MKVTKKFTQILKHELALLLFLTASYAFYATPEPISAPAYFGSGPDPLQFIWFLNWRVFIAQHHLPFFYTYFANAPAGTDLSWTTNVFSLGLLTAPLTAKFGAFAVYNGLMLAAPALACWGAYLAAFELTEDYLAALTAGLLFGFSSYMLGQLLDHLNLCFIFAVPFCLWACIAAAKHGWSAWRLGSWLGLGLAFQFGVSQEIFASLVMFAAIAVVVLHVLHPAGRPMLRRLLPGMALGLGLSLALISPLIWDMLRHYADAGRNVAAAKNYSTDLLGFIIPTPLDWLGGNLFEPATKIFQGNYGEEGAYIGLPLLVLLASLVWRNRADPRFSVPGTFALAAAILSLGPYAHALGHEMSTAPWLVVLDLPFLKSMLPIRFMLYAWLAIGMLLAMWLASPGRKYPRYAALAFCLLFLVPSRAYDRNWTSLNTPTMLTDGGIPPDSRILILPEYFNEMGYQYESGMNFTLAAQGYLSGGLPEPFSKWPLYRTIFREKYQKYLPMVDPHMLAAFLATYQVQYVVLTGSTADFADGHTQSAELAALLQQAGWAAVRTDADARLYRPTAPQAMPDATEIEAYMQVERPENRARAIDYETYWVRSIRSLARLAGLNAQSLLDIYVAHAHPPLPVGVIVGELW
ncbi:MAG: hypothetical protein P4L52_06330 [Acidocella sp.]|nr:hypothetical protein [Acidocella sp.]